MSTASPAAAPLSPADSILAGVGAAYLSAVHGPDRRRATGQLLGSAEPRICTPPRRELTGRIDPSTGEASEAVTTLGYAAIDFAEHVLKIRLYPWQKALLIRALELREDSTFRFRNLVVLVARQNGKSTLSQVLVLFSLYVLHTPLVLGTAQDLDTAEEVWDGVQEMIEDNRELGALALPPILRNGKKTIRLQTGERYKVKAAGRRAGRGLSGDLVLLDELREHQTWDAWSALTKTTMARPNAQIWALSNAGDATSVVLRYLRAMAHKALGDPDGVNANADPASLLTVAGDAAEVGDVALEESDDSLGIFEWSAPPGCSVWDRAGWAQGNPSVGHGGFTERSIASAAATDPEGVFRTEVLCQWVDGVLAGPFPAGAWDAGIDEDVVIAEGARVGYCLDVAWDRSAAYIGAAGSDGGDGFAVEVIARRPGTEWVTDWFTDPAHPQRTGYPVVIQPSAPAGSLIDELTEAGIDVVEWKGLDLGKACGDFYDAVKERRLRHRPAPVLDIPAGLAVTRMLPGDTWVWDRRKSPVDISGLVAVTGALWLATTAVDEVDPFFAFA